MTDYIDTAFGKIPLPERRPAPPPVADDPSDDVCEICGGDHHWEGEHYEDLPYVVMLTPAAKRELAKLLPDSEAAQ